MYRLSTDFYLNCKSADFCKCSWCLTVMELSHPRDVHSPLVLVLRGLAGTAALMLQSIAWRTVLGRAMSSALQVSVVFLPGALVCWLCSLLLEWEVDGAHAPLGPVKHPPAHSLGAELCLQQGLELPEAPREWWSCSGKTLATDTQALLERAGPPLPIQTPDLLVQFVC